MRHLSRALTTGGIATLALTLALTGCGKNTEDPDTSSKPTTTADPGPEIYGALTDDLIATCLDDETTDQSSDFDDHPLTGKVDKVMAGEFKGESAAKGTWVFVESTIEGEDDPAAYGLPFHSCLMSVQDGKVQEVQSVAAPGQTEEGTQDVEDLDDVDGAVDHWNKGAGKTWAPGEGPAPLPVQDPSDGGGSDGGGDWADQF